MAHRRPANLAPMMLFGESTATCVCVHHRLARTVRRYHVARTGDIGLFKITAEGDVAGHRVRSPGDNAGPGPSVTKME